MSDLFDDDDFRKFAKPPIDNIRDKSDAVEILNGCKAQIVNLTNGGQLHQPVYLLKRKGSLSTFNSFSHFAEKIKELNNSSVRDAKERYASDHARQMESDRGFKTILRYVCLAVLVAALGIFMFVQDIFSDGSYNLKDVVILVLILAMAAVVFEEGLVKAIGHARRLLGMAG